MALPDTAELYEAELKASVQTKIDNGEVLGNKELMILNGKTEIYDPTVSAYRQVTIADAYQFLKSLEQVGA